MGDRSETESAQPPLRAMPVRQGKIGGNRSADFDQHVLLHELSRSRAAVRAAGVGAARA